MTDRNEHPIAALAAALLLPMASMTIPPAASADDPPARHHEIIPPAGTVPGESVYQLKAALTDQNGKQTSLDALRGQPVLITLFYTSCPGVCPMLASALKDMEAALPAQERARLRVAMISFDPQRDTPQALRRFGEQHGVDQARWLLGRASEDTVRELAAVFGIRYRAVSDGVYSHSAVIVLLDAQGVIRARTENLQTPDPKFMQSLRALLTEAQSV